MKKIICVVLTLILCITAVNCFAEDVYVSFLNPLMEDVYYYIGRPNVKCRSLDNPDDFVTLHFGEEVKILNRRGEYTDIEYGDGQKGYVTTGFIVESNYPMMYIADDAELYLSPLPVYTPKDFGYGAGGMRYGERAIIIIGREPTYLIVTEEGFMGYVPSDTPYLSVYTGE